MIGCASKAIVEPVNVAPVDGNRLGIDKVEAIVAHAGAYRLRNDKVEAIVSPVLRRVVSFRRLDGRNVLFTPQSGATNLDDASYPMGETIWFWPQNRWPVNGTDSHWPPPDDLTLSPGYRVISANDGKLIVESREQKTLAVIVRRVYRLDDEKLIIDTTMKPARPDVLPSELEGWALWSVVVLPRPSEIVANRVEPDAYRKLNEADELPADNFIHDERCRWIRTYSPLERSAKAGMDATRIGAWNGGIWRSADKLHMSLFYESNFVLVEGSAISRTAPYLPGERAQVYTHSHQGKLDHSEGYVEFEFTAPLTPSSGIPSGLRVEISIHDAANIFEARELMLNVK